MEVRNGCQLYFTMEKGRDISEEGRRSILCAEGTRNKRFRETSGKSVLLSHFAVLTGCATHLFQGKAAMHSDRAMKYKRLFIFLHKFKTLELRKTRLSSIHSVVLRTFSVQGLLFLPTISGIC